MPMSMASLSLLLFVKNAQDISMFMQVHTDVRVLSIYFKDSYKFINLPLCLLPKSFGFYNELQKGFFFIY